MAYDWPGNLRELARVLDHAHAHPRGDGPLIAAGRPARDRSAATWVAAFPHRLSRSDQAARRAADRGRAPADRNRPATVTQQQVARRRDPGDLPTPPLSPDQGTQPPRRRRISRTTTRTDVSPGILASPIRIETEKAPSHPCSGAPRQCTLYREPDLNESEATPQGRQTFT